MPITDISQRTPKTVDRVRAACIGLIIVALSACGGGGSSGGVSTTGGTASGSNASQGTATGVFIDSAVEGISYVSGNISGTTDANGTFTYEVGKPVRFMIGDIVIGEAQGKGLITPMDFVSNSDASNPTVLNIVRLLLTLDDDGIPDNGIKLTDTIRNLSKGKSINFAQSTDVFGVDSNVQATISEITAATAAGVRTLATVDSALTHLSKTEVVLQPGPSDGKDIWTTSVYSYAPGGGGPGGGLDNELLRVGGWGDLYYSLLQFNLAALPNKAANAQLQLYMPTITGAGTTAFYLDRITESWDWKTQGTGADRERLWWADKPAAAQWLQSPLPAPGTAAQWYTIDITDLYNAWQSGTYPNYGVQLRPVSNQNQWSTFYSSNYMDDPALRPKIVVTLAQPGNSGNGNSGNTGGGTCDLACGLNLARTSGCLACHDVQRKVIGPALQDVANRYKGATQMTATLSDGTVVTGAPNDVLNQVIHKGGKGNWTAVTGGVPMPPFSPRVADADIATLVDFVLSLAK